MNTIYKNIWFDFDDKNLFNLCLKQIQQKQSFEIHVPARAAAVGKAVNAFNTVDEASA